MANERLFQVALGVFVLEVEELQDEGVLDLFAGKRHVLGTLFLAACQHGGPVLGESRALVELGADLPVELADRPPAPQRLGFVELAGALVLDGQQPHVGRPGQREGRQKVAEVQLNVAAPGYARRRLENCRPGVGANLPDSVWRILSGGWER